MENQSDQMTLKQLCEMRGVKYQDALDLLTLYDLDAPEDDILTRIETYPIPARKLVADLILPQIQ